MQIISGFLFGLIFFLNNTLHSLYYGKVLNMDLVCFNEDYKHKTRSTKHECTQEFDYQTKPN